MGILPITFGNDEQTEAVFDLDGSNKPIDVILENGQSLSINYRIPSQAECLTCHKNTEIATPNGPKPQNLNADLEYQDWDYESIDEMG